MARYTGPVCKLCNRCGEKLFLKGSRCLTPKCAQEKHRRPTRRRRRVSDRGLQLMAKQKVRYTYGMLEKQFRGVYTRAERQMGITGDNFQVLLERRLDNVVFRLGFADSRSQARQLVRHGHIIRNGRKNDIPSCLVGEGDTIGWKQSSSDTVYYKELVESIKAKSVPGWLNLDRQSIIGQVVSLPTPDEIDAKFDGQAVVEYYSR